MRQTVAERGMVASLPWYDLPEIRGATDAFWAELARQFTAAGLSPVPGALNRDVAYERQWTSPDFLFGQACGYDVRISHADRLQVVATPCFDAPGCEGSNYRSYIVVREDSHFECVEDLRGTRCVINTPTSHSGMNVLRALVAPLHLRGRFFAEIRLSGSHEQSLRMIQRRDVDVAAIDCVTHALLARHRPRELDGSRVLHCTQQVPAPPYVTSRKTAPDLLQAMREALLRTLEQPAITAARGAMLLSSIDILPDDAYGTIESLAHVATHHDYHEIPGRVNSHAVPVR